MEIEEILIQLEKSDGLVPVAAITAAMEMPVLISPILIHILDDARKNAEELKNKKYQAPIFAMILLSQFREKKAYELVVNLFSIPGETALELTGDFVTEYLMKVLASVCCGDLTLIQKLIEDGAVNEYVRSAALRSLLILVAANEVYRDEIIEYFEDLFSGSLEKAPSLVWCTLVDCCGELHGTELEQQIKQAFEDNRVDPEIVSMDQIMDRLKSDREVVLEELAQNPSFSVIYDALFELVGS